MGAQVWRRGLRGRVRVTDFGDKAAGHARMTRQDQRDGYRSAVQMMSSETTMTRMTARDFDQEFLNLYDFHAHGQITKREFLDQAARFAGAGLTAAAALSLMSPDYALAWQVSCTDPAIFPEYVT